MSIYKTVRDKRFTFLQIVMIIFPRLFQKLSNKYTSKYKIVGRDNRIDLNKYQTKVKGRYVLNYQKLKKDDPDLYNDVLKKEKEYDLERDDGL